MVQAQAPAHVPAQPGVVIIPAKKDTVVSFLTVLFVALLAYVGLHQSQQPSVVGRRRASRGVLGCSRHEASRGYRRAPSPHRLDRAC